MGAILAVEEWNRNGGVYGGHPIELFTRDTGGDPTKATTISEEMVGKNVSAVLGGTGTAEAIPMAKVLAAAQIPMVTSSAADAARAAGPDGKIYTFFMYNADFQHPEIIMEFCATKEIKKVAIVYNNVSWPQGLTELANKAKDSYKEKYGVEIVGDVMCDMQSEDYSAEVAELMNLQPDAVYGLLIAGPWSVWLKSYSDAGAKMPMLMPFGMVENAWRTLDKSLTAGLIYGFSYETEEKPLYAEAYQKLLDLFGRAPETVLWDRGYQGANDILNAIDAVGPSGAAVRDYMAGELYGSPTVLGKIDTTCRYKEGALWNDIPYYCSLEPQDYAWCRVDEQGEKVFLK